ncbi:MAG: alpha/beta hydrolase family protein [Gammaproteobacteria bacterium]|nr:alpha/beta hydrolase family protein [Gammaproteobacteria bacterium]
MLTKINNTTFLDRGYSSLGSVLYRHKPKLFSRGWGDQSVFESLNSWDAFRSQATPIHIDWQYTGKAYRGFYCSEGDFESVFDHTAIPDECRRANFMMLLPEKQFRGPLFVHLAASGDEGYKNRLDNIAVPLAQQGIGSIILENPFFGRRRPKDQFKVRLLHASDLLLLGALAVQDVRALLDWFRQRHDGLLGVTGISMGGHLTSLAAGLTQYPLAVVPCLAPHSGTAVFVDGLTADHIDWSLLAKETGSVESAKQRMRDALTFTSVSEMATAMNAHTLAGVCARNDGFVPLHSSLDWQKHHPNGTFTWLNGGHVSNILFRKRVFVEQIVTAAQANSLEEKTDAMAAYQANVKVW